MNIAKRCCGECQLGPNSPFSESIQTRLRADLLSGFPFTCHWREKREGDSLRSPTDCFSLSDTNDQCGPLCATAMAALKTLPQTPEVVATLSRHSGAIETYGPEDVVALLPPRTTLSMTINSPFGSGQIIISRED